MDLAAAPEPLTVGRFYRVPCIRAEMWKMMVPLFGPLHEDAEIVGFPEQHWHIDWRFIPERIVEKWSYGGKWPLHSRVLSAKNTTGPVELLRLKCKRLMPEFPTHHQLVEMKVVAWLPDLEEAHKDARLKCGMICPPPRPPSGRVSRQGWRGGVPRPRAGLGCLQWRAGAEGACERERMRMMETQPLPPVALSIRQPWAWLIVQGYKDVENRTWATGNRGPFLIHAAKGMTLEEYNHARWIATRNGVTIPAARDLERGGIVGAAEITGLVFSEAAAGSPWFFGPVGFQVANARPLPFMPCKGALGFFKPDLPATSQP